MATIYERKNKDGSSSYRVQIRRKGLKKLSLTFFKAMDAVDFVNEFEEKYCLNPELYDFNKSNDLLYCVRMYYCSFPIGY